MRGVSALPPACMLAVATLSSLLILSSQADPPSLRVDDLSHIDADLSVRVYGLVVCVSLWDDGSAKLLLADHLSGATAIVRFGRFLEEGFVMQVRIGDMVRVEGRATSDPGTPVVFATEERSVVLSRSEHSLSIDYLCDNWALFQYDRFKIAGMLERDLLSGTTRLANAQGDRSILVDCESPPEAIPGGESVTAEVTLLVDRYKMVIFLEVWSMEVTGQ